ncbi:hypothetical protein RRG08_004967 [Elysia crispata]|uniref:Uncharacterized protein n=1 Tax=Elysia crispata TaxID=231223 RepID=A0AAE0ZHT4_9GAST|nr:hypothetical protein RRG08_004967 [Elysia crispata]
MLKVELGTPVQYHDLLENITHEITRDGYNVMKRRKAKLGYISSLKPRAERLEWVADTWDQARAEILQERHQILNRKLVLQHALVKAQDRRAELRRHLENEAETQCPVNSNAQIPVTGM